MLWWDCKKLLWVKKESVSLSKVLSKQVQLDEEMIIGLYACAAWISLVDEMMMKESISSLRSSTHKHTFSHTSSQALAIITSSLLKEFTRICMYVCFLSFFVKNSTPNKIKQHFKSKAKKQTIFWKGRWCRWTQKLSCDFGIFVKSSTASADVFFVQGSSKIVLSNYFVWYYFFHKQSVQKLN